MIFSLRHCVAIFAASLGWSEMALGQDSSGSSGSSNSSSAFGSGSGSSSSFSAFSSEPATTPIQPAAPAAPATSEDAGTAFSIPSFGSNTMPESKPPSFTVPGFYGQGSTTFFGGSGRLARPRFRTGFSFGIGYDDNLFSTPSENTPQIVPGASQFIDENGDTQTVQQFETRTEVVRTGNFIDLGGGLLVPETRTITTQVPIEVEDTIIPPRERKGSMFTRVGLNLEMQRFSRRSLFTLNTSASHQYYWDKDEEPVDYSGNFSLTYLFRVTPRLQVTAQANVAYISQPDLSRPNTPQQEIQGDLINALGRLDATYRISPRLSLTGTANYDANRYTETSEQSGDFDEYTFGLEMRYLWQPRWTLLAEVRHAMTTYANRVDLDSTTDYLLVGGEFVLSHRLSGSMRLGAAFKSFDSGGNQIAPYVESTVTYRSTARSSISWSNRFGFEEPQSVTQERLVYRANISYNYTFTPHLQGSIGANIVHEITTEETSNSESSIDTVEVVLGLEYQMTRNFSLSGNYNFTLSNTSAGTDDYYRNRVSIGGQYSF